VLISSSLRQIVDARLRHSPLNSPTAFVNSPVRMVSRTLGPAEGLTAVNLLMAAYGCSMGARVRGGHWVLVIIFFFRDRLVHLVIGIVEEVVRV
jgi:hypothetical protein